GPRKEWRRIQGSGVGGTRAYRLRLLHLREGRQMNMQGQTTILVPGCPDTAPVSLDNGPADGQPHAQPFRLGAHEVFEDPLQFGLVHTGAAVADGNVDARLFGLTGHDANLAW